jgi:hypothetical protein
VMPDIEPDHGELNWILAIGHECWYFTVTEFHTNEYETLDLPWSIPVTTVGRLEIAPVRFVIPLCRDQWCCGWFRNHQLVDSLSCVSQYSSIRSFGSCLGCFHICHRSLRNFEEHHWDITSVSL